MDPGARDLDQALTSLVEAHSRYVWRALRNLGVRDADVEDLCQEVFLVAAARLADFDGQSPRAWLHAIALRVASDYRRRASHRYEVVGAGAPESRAREGVTDAEARHTYERLLALLDGLPEGHGAIFLLYEIEQLTLKEIAQAMGIPLQTVYSRLIAVRDAVQAHFAESPTEER